jgi:hypothetical protein
MGPLAFLDNPRRINAPGLLIKEVPQTGHMVQIEQACGNPKRDREKELGKRGNVLYGGVWKGDCAGAEDEVQSVSCAARLSELSSLQAKKSMNYRYALLLRLFLAVG